MLLEGPKTLDEGKSKFFVYFTGAFDRIDYYFEKFPYIRRLEKVPPFMEIRRDIQHSTGMEKGILRECRLPH